MKDPCKRCGECCKHGGPCDIRGWVTMPRDRNNIHFEGTCDLLQQNDDDTTTCLGIKSAFDRSLGWHEPTRKWLTEKFIGSGCHFYSRGENIQNVTLPGGEYLKLPNRQTQEPHASEFGTVTLFGHALFQRRRLPACNPQKEYEMNRIAKYYEDGFRRPPEPPEPNTPHTPNLSRNASYGSRGARGLLSGLWGGMGILFDSGAVITLTCGFLACWWVLWFIAGHAIKTAWGM